VHLLSQISGGRAEVEAAGGINRFKQISDLMRAGATRIGTDEAVNIIKDFYKWEIE
jgi:deoxyribose-phosphate aldolase